jgi:PiT family inorganic phosphate transporter
LIDHLLYISVGMILALAFVNGFHDGATSSPRLLPVTTVQRCGHVGRIIGPVVLGRVSQTIFGNILNGQVLAHLAPTTLSLMIIGGLAGAIFWNLITWWLRLPSSSSHALIGGLIGACLATTGAAGVAMSKVVRSVVLPLLGAPLVAFVGGLLASRQSRRFCPLIVA